MRRLTVNEDTANRTNCASVGNSGQCSAPNTLRHQVRDCLQVTPIVTTSTKRIQRATKSLFTQGQTLVDTVNTALWPGSGKSNKSGRIRGSGPDFVCWGGVRFGLKESCDGQGPGGENTGKSNGMWEKGRRGIFLSLRTGYWALDGFLGSDGFGSIQGTRQLCPQTTVPTHRCFFSKGKFLELLSSSDM